MTVQNHLIYPIWLGLSRRWAPSARSLIPNITRNRSMKHPGAEFFSLRDMVSQSTVCATIPAKGEKSWPNPGNDPPTLPRSTQGVKLADFLRATSLRAPTGIRNRALVVLGWRAGLRCEEALALYPKDVDLADSSIRVPRGKGSKSRTVGLDPAACAIVQRWLQKRAALGLKNRRPLFCTLNGQPPKRRMCGR